MKKLFYNLFHTPPIIPLSASPLRKIAGVCLLVSFTSISVGQITNNTIDYTNGTHSTICATPAEGGTASMTAPSGTVFTTVTFASYGTPTGTCPNFSTSSCNAASSQSIVEGYLLGNGGTVNIPANNATYSDPCSGTVKKLYVQATYTQPICSGTSPGTITGSTPNFASSSLNSYTWQQSTTSSSSGFSNISGTNSINYTPGNITQTTWFKRIVKANDGSTDYSAALQITVNAGPSAPTVT